MPTHCRTPIGTRIHPTLPLDDWREHCCFHPAVIR
jgi:hypothetical protein